jgi:hypothetical protein
MSREVNRSAVRLMVVERGEDAFAGSHREFQGNRDTTQ